MRFLLSIFFLFSLHASDYLSNKKCKECHEAIYNEYEHSAHHLSYFTDELHRKVANASDPKRYACAPCHMPAAADISALVSGRDRPDPRDVRERDGVSCFFCHTIAYVKKAHKFNLNLPARQAEGYKPSLFGSLFNPDDSDKHSSLKSPIYIDNVCMGCHSHKVNDHNVTIFRAMGPTDTSRGCVRCHMPKVPGGPEKRNTRNRSEHHSHRFPGIRDAKFRATGYEIRVARSGDGIDVTLVNKMPHPMIIQPARAKYLEIRVLRHGKTIWRNYRKNPSEDPKAYFAYRFFRNGHPIVIPTPATSEQVNNLAGKEKRLLHYRIPGLQKGDVVEATLWARLAKAECEKAIHLNDRRFTTPMKIKSVRVTLP
ncbi:multiheme c-type cytochrome [Nitratifractor sp.]